MKLADSEQEPGTYQIDFTARSFGGNQDRLSDTGGVKEVVYYCYLLAGDYKGEKKMILLRE